MIDNFDDVTITLTLSRRQRDAIRTALARFIIDKGRTIEKLAARRQVKSVREDLTHSEQSRAAAQSVVTAMELALDARKAPAPDAPVTNITIMPGMDERELQRASLAIERALVHAHNTVKGTTS